MKRGDRAFFYHSNDGKAIVGVVEVVREAYPDPTADTGDWVSVDMKAIGPMPKPVTLAAIKAEPALADIALVRQSRLSVMPISDVHWDRLCRMGEWTA
jgi:predicted RNA-binding protein with PUA-like domain